MKKLTEKELLEFLGGKANQYVRPGLNLFGNPIETYRLSGIMAPRLDSI